MTKMGERSGRQRKKSRQKCKLENLTKISRTFHLRIHRYESQKNKIYKKFLDWKLIRFSWSDRTILDHIKQTRSSAWSAALANSSLGYWDPFLAKHFTSLWLITKTALKSHLRIPNFEIHFVIPYKSVILVRTWKGVRSGGKRASIRLPLGSLSPISTQSKAVELVDELEFEHGDIDLKSKFQICILYEKRVQKRFWQRIISRTESKNFPYIYQNDRKYSFYSGLGVIRHTYFSLPFWLEKFKYIDFSRRYC